MKRNGNNRNRGKNHLLNDSYANNILLKIIRNHPESEAIKLLTQELERVRVEKGQLSSYVAELEDKLKSMEEMTPGELSTWRFENKRDKKLLQLESQVKNLKQDLQKSNTEKKQWRDKCIALLPQVLPKTE